MDLHPKKILFVIRSYCPDQVGGGAKSVQTLAEGLASRGHEVHIVRLAPRGQEEAVRVRAIEAGVVGPGKPQLHILPIRNVYWPFGGDVPSKPMKAIWHMVDLCNIFAARDLTRLLKELRPDIVNTSIIDGFSPSILRAVRRSGAKLIHTMRDYYLICSRSSMYREGRNCTSLCGSCRLVRAINRPRLSNVDMFLSNSAYVADTHKNFGALPPGAPCTVQWNVNDRPLSPEPRQICDDAITFGFIGRLTPAKGLDKLLEAVTLLPQRGRRWSLVIAGDGATEYVEDLKSIASTLPEVVFLGWVAAGDFYDRVDVVICPSAYNEPLPRVIYEAYGFALPVIASRVGGHPEIVSPGASGELYSGDDIAELAERIQMFRELSSVRYREYSASALGVGSMFMPHAVLDGFEQHMSTLSREPGAHA